MITEQQLMQVIDTAFPRYDHDRSGKLNAM